MKKPGFFRRAWKKHVSGPKLRRRRIHELEDRLDYVNRLIPIFAGDTRYSTAQAKEMNEKSRNPEDSFAKMAKWAKSDRESYLKKLRELSQERRAIMAELGQLQAKKQKIK